MGYECPYSVNCSGPTPVRMGPSASGWGLYFGPRWYSERKYSSSNRWSTFPSSPIERGGPTGCRCITSCARQRAALRVELARDPAEVLGMVFPGDGEATIENVAANCVMAGCLPEYVPV